MPWTAASKTTPATPTLAPIGQSKARLALTPPNPANSPNKADNAKA